MKKLSAVLIVTLFILTNFIPVYADSLNLDSQSCILIDAKSGQILYEKDSDKKIFPASTTKIMTAILAIEIGNPDQIMTASKAAVYDIGVDGMNIGIMPGEELRMEDLLNAMLIKSANETANIIAENLAPTRKDFVDLMNKRAKELGAVNTNFVNPCGSHDPNHFTTASDMAKIARYAMTLPKFCEIVAKKEYSMPPTNKHPKWDIPLYSTNKLTDNRFKSPLYRVLGMKTGYTSQAGNNFISSAVNNDGMELIGAVMSVRSPIADRVFYNSKDLLEYGFKNFSLQKIAEANQLVKTLPVMDSVNNSSVDLVLSSSVECVLPADKSSWNIETEQYINPAIQAPIKQGEVLGWVEYTRNGVSLGKSQIVAAANVEKSMKARAIGTAKQTFSNPTMKKVSSTTIIVIISFIIIRFILKRVSQMVNARRQED